jgi:conjugative transposon TraJ protein
MFESLHLILRNLYAEMMPLCGAMAGVAKGIAGLGALFYVAYRVWQSLARAEPIDVYPLLRPFAIGLCIMFFPTIVVGTLNTVLSPTVKGTQQLLQSQTFDMHRYQQQKDLLEYEMMTRQKYAGYLDETDEDYEQQLKELIQREPNYIQIGVLSFLYDGSGIKNLKKKLRILFRELMELLFNAAALVIDTLRTFFLIVLTILGPLAFAFSVWDGFHSTLTQWLSRYISIYLWLPVADLFSAILAKIQVLSLQKDIAQLQSGSGALIDSSDGVLIVFMIIGIVGYCTIPTVAGWIISAGGIGSYNRNVQAAAAKTGALAGAATGAAAGNITGRLVK